MCALWAGHLYLPRHRRGARACARGARLAAARGPAQPAAASAPSFAVLLNLLLLAAVLYFHVLAPMLAPAEVAPPPPKKCLLGLFSSSAGRARYRDRATGTVRDRSASLLGLYRDPYTGP